MRLSISSELADEITIKVFLSAWDNISFLRDDMPFAAWITGITIHTFLQEYLLNGKAKENKSGIVFPKSYQKSRLEESLVSLPDKERFLIVFHLIEKYSLEEASDFLGIPLKEAKSNFESACRLLLEANNYVYNYDQLKSRIESLPDKIEPAPSVWEEIVSCIKKEKIEQHEKIEKAIEQELKDKFAAENAGVLEHKEEIKKEKKKKAKKPAVKKLKKRSSGLSYVDRFRFGRFFSVLIVIIAVSGILYLLFRKDITWEINHPAGTVMINLRPALEGSDVKEGEIISSNKNSRFTLDITDIGEVTALDNSALKRMGDSRLKLIQGNFKIKKDGASAFLTADVFSTQVIDVIPGGYYEVNIGPEHAALLSNKTGDIKVKTNMVEFYIAPGYQCLINEDNGPGIPYHKHSSEQVKSLLEQLNSSSANKDEIADRLLLFAEDKDLISLFDILRLVSPMKRGDIFDYFTKLIMMTDTITKEGIIYLNDKMMSQLRAQLETAAGM